MSAPQAAPLRQSLADWCYFKGAKDPAEHYRKIATMGYHGVEMVDPSRWEFVRSAGLEIVNIGAPGMEVGLNHREHHADLIPKIAETIRTASANGIKQVIVLGGNRAKLSDQQGIANCVEGLSRLVPIAEAERVTMTFEMLNKFDHVDYHADTVAFSQAVVTGVNSPRLKFLCDFYHLQRMNEPLLESALKMLPSIAHIHVAGSPRRNFPGPEQEIDFAKLVSRVHAAGYRGYWGQEFKPTGDSLDELKRAHDLFARYAVQKMTCP